MDDQMDARKLFQALPITSICSRIIRIKPNETVEMRCSGNHIRFKKEKALKLITEERHKLF